MYKAALVLEGGSLRCMFSAAVVDRMMEEQIHFEYVNGVSSGSLTGMNYVANQIGRTANVSLKFVNDKRYMGLQNLIKNKQIFNFDFLFGDIAKKYIPFDEETFERSPMRYEVGVTNCITGKQEYLSKENCADMYLAASASSSMPMVSKMIMINQHYYLDGGIAMPIAYDRASKLGYQKIVVVLTREQGYRKTGRKKAVVRAYHKLYENYPNLIRRMDLVPEHYNQMQEEIDQLEAEGKIFVIRPLEPVLVGRMEKDTNKLQDLYQKGRAVANQRWDDLIQYLEN